MCVCMTEETNVCLCVQAPKKDHVKQRKYDGVVLRFDAHIKDPSPIDSLRKFLVAWCVVLCHASTRVIIRM